LQCCSIESEKQRAELQHQHEAEQKATVDQLMSLKDSEMAALKHGWQHKVNDLLHEVEIVDVMFICRPFHALAYFWFLIKESYS